MSATTSTADVTFDFDADALKRKYLAERDKRLRADANEQYVGIEGRFAHFNADPYADPTFTRAPLNDDVDAIIIGGGFSGLLAGARLRDAGVGSIRIIDRAADFGGTWYWNRYPGIACDIESYIYLPLLEETGYMPKRKYADGVEIWQHCQRIGQHFGLYEHACFQTQVRDIRWDETRGRWVVRTDRDDCMTAQHVIVGPGPLNRPKLPGIPGIERFEGHSFHTSRWDYAYTGGSPSGGLDRLHDKRVGIIGTGASAVQCVPHLGASAQHLYVFQRTPSSVDVRGDHPTDATWAQSLAPGWQRKRQLNFEALIVGADEPEDLVGDGWTEIFRTVFSLAKSGKGAVSSDASMEELRQLADFRKMEQVRARVDAIVKDPATAEALKPYYNQFCKRPCFHDDYLPTFNRPNVTLVDTQGHGVERITERGVVVAGVEYELDCIVFATGFEVGTDYTRRADFEVYGRGGRTLTEHWHSGFTTLHGMQTRHFPNMFFVGGSQAATTANIPLMADEQCKHIAKIVRHCMDRQIGAIEVKQSAIDAWQQAMREKAVTNGSFFQDCTPGYYNGEGKENPLAFFAGQYGGGPFDYMGVIERWIDDGLERDLDVQRR